MLNLEYSKKLKNVGKIIVCLIKYANDEDIKQFINYCFPKITKYNFQEKEETSWKEYFIYKLCLSQYHNYEYICEANIVNVKKNIKKTKLDSILLHLIALQESFEEAYSLLSFGIKDLIDTEKFEKYSDILQNKKGFKKLLDDRPLTDDDISALLHIIIDNYAKYKFYYIFCGDKVKKIEIKDYKESYVFPDTKIKRHNKEYRISETDYNIVLHERYATLINTETNKKIKVEAMFKPYYINSDGESDIKIINLKSFKKINSALVKALSKI